MENYQKLVDQFHNDPRRGVQTSLERFKREMDYQDREKHRIQKMLEIEKTLIAKGVQGIAGIDEAGRGPWVGPVVAAAVVLPAVFHWDGLNDSKKVSQARREDLFLKITSQALDFGVGSASAAEIDQVNIYRATQIAMERAVQAMHQPPQYLLIDAMNIPNLAWIPQKNIIHGDACSASIAAASIVAKVTRDHWMEQLDLVYPQYAFKQHKGYGTTRHWQAIQKYGICPEHRRSFSPIAQWSGIEN
jgi:ribonuclease HII